MEKNYHYENDIRFTSPTKGKIKILGLDPELEKNKTSTYIGYLPENPLFMILFQF